MRRTLAQAALTGLCVLIGGGLVLSLTGAATYRGGYSIDRANDYDSAQDTVSSAWVDTFIPDGNYNAGFIVQTPPDANVAGVYVKLSPSGGPANTDWMLVRENTARWFWTQVDTIFFKGGGASDTTGITRYECLVPQWKGDN